MGIWASSAKWGYTRANKTVIQTTIPNENVAVLRSRASDRTLEMPQCRITKEKCTLTKQRVFGIASIIHGLRRHLETPRAVCVVCLLESKSECRRELFRGEARNLQWIHAHITAPIMYDEEIGAQELCESGGGHAGPSSPYGVCGRKATLNHSRANSLLNVNRVYFLNGNANEKFGMCAAQIGLSGRSKRGQN